MWAPTVSVSGGSVALCRSNFSLLTVGCLSFGASCESLRKAPDGKTQTRFFYFFLFFGSKSFPLARIRLKAETAGFLGGCSIAFTVRLAVPVPSYDGLRVSTDASFQPKHRITQNDGGWKGPLEIV